MAAPRRFDHDECRALYATGGWTHKELAAKYGVSPSRINRIVNPAVGERALARQRERQRQGVCPDCGAQTTLRRRGASTRCIPCQAVARSTTARPDTLQCAVCREWKPDADFPSNRSEKYGRRGRHGVCRACQTVARRNYRRRHREAENSYQRAYKRSQRAKASA